MQTNFKNVSSAYDTLNDYIEEFGSSLMNFSRRSSDYMSEVKEVLGVSFSIQNIFEADIFNLIKKIDLINYKTRINFIKKLGVEFIKDEIVRTKLHYSYNNRILPQKSLIIENIKKGHPANRQAFLGIWQPFNDSCVLDREEVPCSIGYCFFARHGKLNMVYFMRSLDLFILPNDIYLSRKVLSHIAERSDLEVGNTTFQIASLHKFIRG